MIFWIFIILLVMGMVLYSFGCYKGKISSSIFYLAEDIFCGIGITFFFIGAAASVFMLFFIVLEGTNSQGTKVSLEQQYESLIYKSKTEACRDEFGIINKEYIDEVQEWNMYIAKNQRNQKDFWIGIFYPNIFDDFKIIDLDSIRYKK